MSIGICREWYTVSVANITHVMAAHGIRMPFFSHSHIPKQA
ncbi:hypothetical protein [Desmospora activa]|nr:hypothetical protein [Desmospora activa]